MFGVHDTEMALFEDDPINEYSKQPRKLYTNALSKQIVNTGNDKTITNLFDNIKNITIEELRNRAAPDSILNRSIVFLAKYKKMFNQDNIDYLQLFHVTLFWLKNTLDRKVPEELDFIEFIEKVSKKNMTFLERLVFDYKDWTAEMNDAANLYMECAKRIGKSRFEYREPPDREVGVEVEVEPMDVDVVEEPELPGPAVPEEIEEETEEVIPPVVPPLKPAATVPSPPLVGAEVVVVAPVQPLVPPSRPLGPFPTSAIPSPPVPPPENPPDPLPQTKPLFVLPEMKQAVSDMPTPPRPPRLPPSAAPLLPPPVVPPPVAEPTLYVPKPPPEGSQTSQEGWKFVL